MSNINAMILILLNCCLLVLGQLLWKIGLKQIQLNSIKSYFFALFNGYVFTGLVVYAFATLIWFYILKKYDLVKIYPLQSISYIIAMLVGYFILHENITKNSIIGTLLIIAGVSIITMR